MNVQNCTQGEQMLHVKQNIIIIQITYFSFNSDNKEHPLITHDMAAFPVITIIHSS